MTLTDTSLYPSMALIALINDDEPWSVTFAVIFSNGETAFFLALIHTYCCFESITTPSLSFASFIASDMLSVARVTSPFSYT